MATSAEGRMPGLRVVAIWACLLVLAAVVVQAAHVGAVGELRDAPDRPWIGLPGTGTDITGLDARRALEDRLHAGAGSLAARCGTDADLPAERYVGLVVPGNAAALEVVIDVRGDDVTLSPAPGTHWPGTAGDRPRRFQRGEAKGIREAWTTPLLWGGGMPAPIDARHAKTAHARLEACVEGGYALRTGTYAGDVRALYTALSQAIARH